MRTDSEVNLALLERNQQLSTSLVYERLERRRWQWAACLFGLIAVGLGVYINSRPVLTVVALVILLAGLFAGGLAHCAHRGDQAMGVGDTQGRDKTL